VASDELEPEAEPDVDDDEEPEAEDDDEPSVDPVGHHRVAVTAPGRLDTTIAAAVAGLSRAQVKRLIDDGRVAVGGAAVTKAGHKVRAGDAIDVDVPAPAPLALVAEPIPLVVLYEDEHVIAIDKPAGLVVHPAPGHASGTLVNALLHHCRDLAGIGGVRRPGIVHRLDKDTSGVLIAAKHDRAHTALVAAFQAKAAMVRSYVAITAPGPAHATQTLRTHYGRHPVHRKRFSSKVAAGKLAITHVEVVARGAALDVARVRCRLETGRTHQIRVHCADHGFALVGDPVYAPRPRDARIAAAAARLARQALHAERLELDHPVTGARLALVAPPPADFREAWDALST
jgi:23S rRNA pseudouridine1911/1915/1917 synthase